MVAVSRAPPCTGVNEARAATSARDVSPTFSRGETTNAQSIAYVYAGEPAATEAFDKLASAETRTCLGTELAERVGDEPDVKVGEAKTSRVAIDPIGDQREADISPRARARQRRRPRRWNPARLSSMTRRPPLAATHRARQEPNHLDGHQVF